MSKQRAPSVRAEPKPRVSKAKIGVLALRSPKVEAVMAAAERSGLLRNKGVGRIGGRVSSALIDKAKVATGISADTDLIEFALANLALEDKFAEAFKASRDTVDSDLELGF